jgi:uncharacterized protein involved in response to NO
LLSIGFRPFFLLAGLAAVALVPCWLAMLLLSARWPSPLLPILWHGHEMLFGYTSAVIAGFLLTATQNWTGQVTARGGRLAALAALWLAGRVVCAVSAGLPFAVAAAIDLAFLPAVALVIAIPIVRTRNRRNMAMPFVLLVLACGNALWWLGALTLDGLTILRAQRVTLDVIALLIMVIGGRIIPGFTANAAPGVSARARNGFDVLGIAALVGLLAVDVIAPRSQLASLLAALAAVLNLARLWGWGGSACLARPILWVLHVGFGCTALALGLRAVAVQTAWLPESTATHLLTVGGIGLLTLGMMARVALGHSGRPLVLSPSIVVALYALAASALIRVAGPIVFASRYELVLWAAGALWTLAFALYLIHYTPIMFAPRADTAGAAPAPPARR